MFKFFDFIHPDDLQQEEFIAKNGIVAFDVIVVDGQFYKFVHHKITKKLKAIPVRLMSLTDWYLKGNRHPLVKWSGSHAFVPGRETILVPCKGKTYFCDRITFIPFESVEGEFEVLPSRPDTSTARTSLEYGMWNK